MADLTFYHDAVARGLPNPELYILGNGPPESSDDVGPLVVFSYRNLLLQIAYGVVGFLTVSSFAYFMA